MDSAMEPCGKNSDSAPRNDLCPALELVDVPIGDLVSAKRSLRTLSKKHIDRVKRSVEEFGFVTPLIVGPNNEIVDGHTRFEVARQLGLSSIPCIRVAHLDERLIRAARIAINKTQEMGTWDEVALKLELEYQLESNTDLTVLGFDAPELDTLLAIPVGAGEDADPADEVEELPAPDAPAVTQTGDVWVLGDHLIGCGNGRDIDTVRRLFGRRSAHLVFTDPPYNVRVNGHVRVATDRFDEFAEASGEMSEEAFTEFLASFIVAANEVRRPGALFYAFMDWRHMREMLEAIRSVGFEMVNLCIWAKPNGGMGSFYRSRHELVFVFKARGEPHRNNIELGRHGRYRTNVWDYAGATGGKADEYDDFSLHPTVKPVRLVADAILDATAVGETVFDPFLGSGTTLLAAERTRRRCIGIEISPAYVDVAIRRWEQMTGREAIHRESGETFATRAPDHSTAKCSSVTEGTAGSATGEC